MRITMRRSTIWASALRLTGNNSSELVELLGHDSQRLVKSASNLSEEFTAA